MLILDLLMIIPGGLDVPIMHETPSLFYQQIASTFFSFLTTIFLLYVESKGVEEHLLEYSMLSVKAKMDWVPFENKLMAGKLDRNLDYNLLKYKIGFVTDMTGFSKALEF